MAKNYIQEGNVLSYTATAAIASGAVVVIGKRIAIALADIAVGEAGAITAEGVFAVAKLGTDVVGQGDLLYWDAANSRLTTTAAGNTAAGFAAAPAGAGVGTVNIKINA
jgi:predicted RecA/RadA family phage recombinase